jgi:hypothetical protein
MTYFADLDRKTLAVFGDAVRAVGWLGRDHEYPTGPTSPEFLSTLRTVRNSWGAIFKVFPGWPALMGVHRCEICEDHVDTGDVAIPFGDVLFVAPTMIVHYVEAHRYLPPADFVTAVLVCPDPSTATTPMRSPLSLVAAKRPSPRNTVASLGSPGWIGSARAFASRLL